MGVNEFTQNIVKREKGSLSSYQIALIILAILVIVIMIVFLKLVPTEYLDKLNLLFQKFINIVQT